MKGLDFEEHFITGLPGSPINLFYCGYHDCPPGHRYGPAMRDHILLHYIVAGKGQYWVHGTEYELASGDCFVFFPNVPATYQADEADPWRYMWAGFDSQMALEYLTLAGISPSSPFHTFRDKEQITELFERLFACTAVNTYDAEALGISYLFQLFACMLKETRPSAEAGRSLPKRGTEEYMQEAIRLIHSNYARKLTVSMMANHVGLERSYFSKRFRELIGVAPYEFLNQYRMEQATRMLIHTRQSVGTIALSVGFEDLSYFSKVFMKHSGTSPTNFRDLHHQLPPKMGKTT
ncbi:AraC family transcriptional regulator [Paenibacillus filicis]|uniref:AraC family transcriptional regulator n=1 Tax=Paenibacillus filicis TaxID=669464 RepID=UPI00311951C9